jgi:hypothetical protein
MEDGSLWKYAYNTWPGFAPGSRRKSERNPDRAHYFGT